MILKRFHNQLNLNNFTFRIKAITFIIILP